MKILSFFNNKGGVGKTTLLYHVAWMLAEFGHKVLVVDLDPQSNTTAMFLDEEALGSAWADQQVPHNIFHALAPIRKGTGDFTPCMPLKIEEAEGNLHLLAGHLGLSTFEDRLSLAWTQSADGEESYLRTASVLYRIIKEAAMRLRSDYVLVDVGPNLGAINRVSLIGSDAYLIPMAADLFSIQGLRNMGPTLNEWGISWVERLKKAERHAELFLALPQNPPKPLGYVIMQHHQRKGRLVKSFENWASMIHEEYAQHILMVEQASVEPIAHIKNYFSLIPMAQEARKPVFYLTPADGAIGAHMQAVRSAHDDFKSLSLKIIDELDNF